MARGDGTRARQRSHKQLHRQFGSADPAARGRLGWRWSTGNARAPVGIGDDPEGLAADPDNSFAVPFIAVHSGTPLDPNRIKPRTIADFSAGVNVSKLRFQADLLNAFNKKGLYNIQSVFGGTHVIPPRMFAARVRYAF